MTNIVELAKSVVDGLRAMKKELDGIEGILNNGGIKHDGPYNPSQMLDAIGVKGKAKKDILAGREPSDKNKKKRKYTKRASYWKNPVKKHAKV